MKGLTFSFFLLTIAIALKAQTISGVVLDDLKKPVHGSTLSLFTTTDSLVKLEISDRDGSFLFKNIRAGVFKITVTHIGYDTYTTEEFSCDSSIVLLPILLTKGSRDLSTVVVTAKKPLIQVRGDRTILNVEGSINATGNTVLELLRKSPGVSLDKDDNISLHGKNGVRIYIDGRPTALSGPDLNSYLQTLQSSSVEAIELITNPSAKFEAAGNAGIINIRLKKNTALGTNVSVNAGFNVGRYAKYNSGFSFNNRNQKMNLFGSYNYAGGMNDYIMRLNRFVADTFFNQRGNIREYSNSHQFKTGFDYNLNNSSIIGTSVHGNFSTPTILNNSQVAITSIPTGIVDRLLIADNTLEQSRRNAAFNLNYTYRDTAGKSISINADHAFYFLNGDQMQPNEYFDASSANRIYRVVYQMISPTDIQISSVNGDYEQDVNGGKISSGGKLAIIHTDNDFQRYNVFETAREIDVDRSNRFRYKEMISAAYANYNKTGNGIVVQVGLRVENTQTEGRSTGLKSTGTGYINFDSSFKRSYTDLFPSAAITFNKDVMKQWTFSYSRRIDRPAYQNLNPFEFKIDEYTSQTGSINLRPQYTHSLGLTYVHNQRLTAAFNYNSIKDLFIQLLDTTEKSKSFISNKNLGLQDVVNLSVTYPFTYKSYSLMANANAHYKSLNAHFGTGREIKLNVTGFSLFAQNSLIFKNTWTAEVTGFYNSPTIYGSNLKVKGMWSVDAGVQNQFFDGKANIKFAVSDVFNSLQFEGSSFFAGQQATFMRKAESRQAKISVTWRFGNTGVKTARERKTAAEEEMKRVQ